MFLIYNSDVRQHNSLLKLRYSCVTLINAMKYYREHPGPSKRCIWALSLVVYENAGYFNCINEF